MKGVSSGDAGFPTWSVFAAFIFFTAHTFFAALALFAAYVFSWWANISTDFPNNSAYSGYFTSTTTNPSAWAKAAGGCLSFPALILWMILHFYVLAFIVSYFLKSTLIPSYSTMQDNILHLIQSLSPQDVVSRKHHFIFVYYLKASTA